MFPGSVIIDSLFWMILGALQILILLGARAWLDHYRKKVAFWKLLLMYLSFVGLCLTVAGGFTLMGEYESSAGWYFIGTLTVPQIIVFALLFKLFILGRKPAMVASSR